MFEKIWTLGDSEDLLVSSLGTLRVLDPLTGHHISYEFDADEMLTIFQEIVERNKVLIKNE